MRDRKAVVSMLTLVLAMSSSAMAQELKDPFHDIEGIKTAFRGALLTDDQLAQILEFRKATTWEREQQIEREKDALWREWKDLAAGAVAVDASQLVALSDRAHALDAERDQLRTQVLLKIREVMTADQLERMAQTHQRLNSLDAQRRALDPTVEAEGLR